MRRVEQERTHRVTLHWITRWRTLSLGVADLRAGWPYHRDYDTWDGNAQWSYERGRMWAALAPRNVPLKRNGQINPDVVRVTAHGAERHPGRMVDRGGYEHGGGPYQPGE